MYNFINKIKVIENLKIAGVTLLKFVASIKEEGYNIFYNFFNSCWYVLSLIDLCESDIIPIITDCVKFVMNKN